MEEREYCPKDSNIIAIGQYSKRTLDKEGIHNIHITHPANGELQHLEKAGESFFSSNVLINDKN
jgi:hypothetical protein